MNNHIKNVILAPLNLLYKKDPVLCTKIMFRLKIGGKLDLEHPLEHVAYEELREVVRVVDGLARLATAAAEIERRSER